MHAKGVNNMFIVNKGMTITVVMLTLVPWVVGQRTSSVAYIEGLFC